MFLEWAKANKEGSGAVLCAHAPDPAVPLWSQFVAQSVGSANTVSVPPSEV